MNLRPFLVLATLTISAFAVGCSDPCGDLEDKCSACKDATAKSLCLATVEVDDSDACDKALSDIDKLCPQ